MFARNTSLYPSRAVVAPSKMKLNALIRYTAPVAALCVMMVMAKSHTKSRQYVMESIIETMASAIVA